MTRRVTIAHIATAAGVSVPTVSKVVNGRHDVAPQTRERVERMLREHGYRRPTRENPPNASLLDVVFNELESPWAMEIIKGVEEVARWRTTWGSFSLHRSYRARWAAPGWTPSPAAAARA